MHDVSDLELSEELGIAWAGGLVGVNPAATATASVKRKGKNLEWTFYGDPPNDVWANPPCRIGDPGVNGEACTNPVNISDNDESNTYSPLRRVNIDGKDVVFNMIFMKWGDEPFEQNRRAATASRILRRTPPVPTTVLRGVASTSPATWSRWTPKPILPT
jgi:hypothetical protein